MLNHDNVVDVVDSRILHRDLHIAYVKKYEMNKDGFEYNVMEHLRVSGIYWALTAMDVMDALHEMEQQDNIISFVLECQCDNGGFAGAIGHDPHLLYTLSAVQVLCIYDRLDAIDADVIMSYVASLQQTDGSFYGDKYGEVDTRFSFCALACAWLLKRMDLLNIDMAVEFIIRCRNFDGGFGSVPGSETHAGQVFCCVGALSITDSLHHVDVDRLGWWLAERQLKDCGGLNGRPEKLPDVCYSWWVVASLAIIDRLHWIDADHLCSFILDAQDTETGGIADRSGDVADPFHTLFGVAGLSLLGKHGLKQIDPVFCLPVQVINRLKK